MKHIILVIYLLFLLPVAVSAQFAKGAWEMGSSFFAGRSWLYNYNDWHGPPMIILSDTVPGDDIFPVSPNPVIKPNAISAGFYAGYYWGKHHGVEAQINYSSVKQMFIYNKFEWGGNKETEDLQLHYITLPISYTLTSNNRYRFQGFAGVGIEPGFLVSYKGEWFSYLNNWQLSGEDKIAHIVYHGTYYSVNFDGEMNKYKMDLPYRRFYLGVAANVGFKSYISDNLGFSFMVRGSTSLINPENHDARKYYNPDNPRYMWSKHGRYGYGTSDSPPKDRAHTYALRVGAELRLFYHLHKNEYTRRLKRK